MIVIMLMFVYVFGVAFDVGSTTSTTRRRVTAASSEAPNR